MEFTLASPILKKLWKEITTIFKSLDNIQNNIILQDIYDAFVLCAELTFDYDESHDISHHVDVFINSISIFKGLEMQNRRYQDVLIMIIYASLLHDIIDHKYPNNLELKIKKVNDFLEQKLPDHSNNIKWIINNMSYKKESIFGYPCHIDKNVQLSRNIVSDSDKLEAIGDVGIRRCQQFSKNINPEATDNEINKMVILHCHEKLLKIKDYMRTSVGKNMANERHIVIEEFIKKNENILH